MVPLISVRLKFEAFADSDVEALASLLADSSITRNITANGSSPERCLAFAHRLPGWCGFIPPDGDETDPEIIYAIDREFRGRGIAAEAASTVIDWLFRETRHGGVTAVIFSRFNPGSVAVLRKLGLTPRGRMEFALFLSSSSLADEVAEYEIWRLAEDATDDLDTLVEQSAFRAGQLSTATSIEAADIRELLAASLARRCADDGDAARQSRLQSVIDQAFGAGRAEAYMDCYHISRERWLEAERA
jgi:GNAT superfamily N-acetyltransferase